MPPPRSLSEVLRKKSPASVQATRDAYRRMQFLSTVTPIDDMRTYVTSAREGYASHYHNEHIWVFSKPILTDRHRSVGTLTVTEYVDKMCPVLKAPGRHVLYELPYGASGLMVCVLHDKAIQALREKIFEVSVGFRALVRSEPRRHMQMLGKKITLTTAGGPMQTMISSTGRAVGIPGLPSRAELSEVAGEVHPQRGALPDIVEAFHRTEVLVCNPRLMLHVDKVIIPRGVLSQEDDGLVVEHQTNPFDNFYKVEQRPQPLA